MLKEFKEFALKGSVVDLAIGVIIGSAFSGIVKSLTDDILMPPIGLLLGGIDFANFFLLLKPGDPAGPYLSLADAQAAGAVTVNYGMFTNTLINFLIITLVLFFIIRLINRLKRE
ncbi:MAG: large conductance mechanosensitive channel protein MscL, partial [Anaerolineae bacterium]|nr:large conductance mechanosensitive channel protein MscL [Anaerolineae bacterium]